MSTVIIFFTAGIAMVFGGCGFALCTRGSLRFINAIWIIMLGTVVAVSSLVYLGPTAHNYPTIAPFVIASSSALMAMTLLVSTATLLKDRRDRAARQGATK